ncbi:MAG: protein translocase subunit SecD [Actinobacteria bacterium]|jgi:preprotein translocase subunit SecD|nr:protein translocase subunit SecD [Actinomycetota bacterium]NCV41731.1 protein translocase subunit SecD [Actinomycetota bacterium]NCV81721.1 protein translocase subunit SecD [Actinomycetota bacterium]NCW72229.1 protein translocase subunit SecD [Actinomycetota bacterium]NCW92088.1 protein translocase subunit SecD [Actinomycetota bacterium]
MSTTTKPVKTTARPARSLAILALVLIALTGLVFVQGATQVRLGLDLRGGTSVTLQPRIAPGENGKVTNEAIDQAVSIIRQRVNSLGVAESEVAAQGSGTNRQIVISVPGDTGRRVVELVGQTAELRFRQVLATAAATGAADPAATPATGVSPEINAKFAALDCTKSENLQGSGADAPEETIVACDRAGLTKYILAPAEVLGRQISKASAGLDAQSGSSWYVSLTFNGEGTTAFGALTSRVTSLAAPLNQVAIVLDGLVVSAPRINEAIPSGNAQITGSFTQLEAQDLANVLKYGALPLAFDRGEVQQVSPTLGADQLSAGLLAGGLGLGLVLLYSMLYYRGLGLVTVGSLAIAASLVYLMFLLLGKWIGFTLTLAGIAGAIVAIGVTADSFIIYFERIRDEIREGRSLRTAVETGWSRARRTILVADFVSIIAAVLLYFFAVGGVRGFAFTLGLTTLVDLIVVFVFTKPIVTILAKMKFFASGHPLSGLSAKSTGTLPVAGEA